VARYGGRRAAAVLALLLVGGCTSSGSPAPGDRPTSTTPTTPQTPSRPPATASPSPAAAAWPTYHGDNQRSGYSTAAALKPPLHRAWSKRLDGAVYAQPLVVGGLLIVATEHNTVYALRPTGGRIVWRRHPSTPVPQSALPCGNIDPTGITGTPAYDRSTGSIFVVTETTGSRHTVHALDWRNGHERWHRNLDVLPNRDRRAEQERGALLVTHGRVYIPFGGRFGDCGNFVGYVVGVRTDNTGRTLDYAVPTARAAGIWAAAGPVQDKTEDDIYVASGNGAEVNGQYDGSDSVIRLSLMLRRTGLFAPSTWRQDNAQDLDLGSSSPLVDPVTMQTVIAGKQGTVYVLNALKGVGRSVASTLSGCAGYGGAAFAGQLVILPCSDGIRMLGLGGGNSSGWRWQLSGVSGSPVIAGRRVYALDTDSGQLVMAALRTGRAIARISVGRVSRFATPVPVGPRVYVGTLDGVVAVRGAA
jgi:outer membrane protein assembly factor BamB